jgi:alpha-D-ribose 1-methylphosphonate 5-triphosphate synthase subunit PhnG
MDQIPTETRQHWMSVLARAPLAELEAAWNSLPRRPEYALLRQPETGLAMVQARTNGSGAPFNMGEMTLTRCAVDVNGFAGHAYVAGRSSRHAELAAVFDGLLQDPEHTGTLTRTVILPLQQRIAATRRTQAAQAAATRVAFFTMVRGEDQP